VVLAHLVAAPMTTWWDDGVIEEPDPHAAHLRARHRPAHARRRADRFAAFLLADLAPGMRLLDLGSGPGTITDGLASAVHPALAVGIDFDPTPAEGTQVTVVTADANRLPFPDATFDAVFSCALLQHVDDPTAILTEARRVCRPGGVIGVADVDWDGFVVHPPDPLLHRGQEVLGALRAKGDPGIGKQLRGLLAEAGFEDVTASARATAEGGPGTAASGAFRAGAFEAPTAVELAVSLGASTEEEMSSIAEAWRRWGHSPGAFFAGFWIEAVGRVPTEDQR